MKKHCPECKSTWLEAIFETAYMWRQDEGFLEMPGYEKRPKPYRDIKEDTPIICVRCEWKGSFKDLKNEA